MDDRTADRKRYLDSLYGICMVAARDERFSAAVHSDPDLERVFSANDVELFRVR